MYSSFHIFFNQFHNCGHNLTVKTKRKLILSVDCFDIYTSLQPACRDSALLIIVIFIQIKRSFYLQYDHL